MSDKITVTFFQIIDTYIAGACCSPSVPISRSHTWGNKLHNHSKTSVTRASKELHLRCCRGPGSASEIPLVFQKRSCKKLDYIQFYTDFAYIFFEIQTWEMRGIMSSCDLEFSAISRMVPLNPCTDIFTQRILKRYMPQKVEKIRQRHVQKRDMPEKEK